MDTDSTALIVIIALAVIAVLVFVTVATSRSAGRSSEVGEIGPRWYEILLAVALLALLAIGIVLLALSQHAGEELAAGTSDWRTGSRSFIFLIMMVALAGVGVLAYAFFVIARLPPAVSARPGAVSGEPSPGAHHEGPAGVRLVGLLGLMVAFLLLGWIYVPRAEQYALMLQLIYPATFALALVLLFDKASRQWSVKSVGETVREWMLCDAIVFLLFIAFLNLRRFESLDQYGGFFWEVLYLAGFLYTFWMLDRKATRYRFLVAYGYFAIAPILLLAWRWVHEIPVPEDLSWWRTVWPFFYLSVIFLVLEIVSLIATRGSNHQGLAAVKDGVFLLLFAIALIVAIPETV